MGDDDCLIKFYSGIDNGNMWAVDRSPATPEKILTDRTLSEAEALKKWKEYPFEGTEFAIGDCEKPIKVEPVPFKALLMALKVKPAALQALDLTGIRLEGPIWRIFLEHIDDLAFVEALALGYLEEMQLEDLLKVQPKLLLSLKKLYLHHGKEIVFRHEERVTLITALLHLCPKLKCLGLEGFGINQEDFMFLLGSLESKKILSLSLPANYLTDSSLEKIAELCQKGGPFDSLASLNLQNNLIVEISPCIEIVRATPLAFLNVMDNAIEERALVYFRAQLEGMKNPLQFYCEGQSFIYRTWLSPSPLPFFDLEKEKLIHEVASAKEVNHELVQLVNNVLTDTEMEFDRKEEVLHALLKKAFRVGSVENDGSCLFTSLSCFLPGCDLRKEAVDYLEENRALFELFFEEGEFDSHCQEMRNPEVWGGDYELNALSTKYQRAIVVFSARFPIAFKEGQLLPQGSIVGEEYLTPDKPPCVLYHEQNGHYLPLLPKTYGDALLFWREKLKKVPNGRVNIQIKEHPLPVVQAILEVIRQMEGEHEVHLDFTEFCARNLPWETLMHTLPILKNVIGGSFEGVSAEQVRRLALLSQQTLLRLKYLGLADSKKQPVDGWFIDAVNLLLQKGAVSHFRLIGFQICAKQIPLIFQGVQQGLQYLSLRGISLRTKGFSQLLEVLKEHCPRELDVSHNHLTRLTAIPWLLEKGRFTSLDFSNNHLGEEVAIELIDELKKIEGSLAPLKVRFLPQLGLDDTHHVLILALRHECNRLGIEHDLGADEDG